MTQNNLVSIDDFDLVSECADGADCQMLNADGSETGVTLVVLGKHSDPVRAYLAKIVNDMSKAEAIARRQNKQVQPKTMDELVDMNIDRAVASVSGWKGVAQQFDKATLRRALKRNPHWVEQIADFSDDLGNFTTARKGSSSIT